LATFVLVWLRRIVGQLLVSIPASWNSRWANPDMLLRREAIVAWWNLELASDQVPPLSPTIGAALRARRPWLPFAIDTGQSADR
jgi:hypothetical protein